MASAPDRLDSSVHDAAGSAAWLAVQSVCHCVATLGIPAQHRCTAREEASITLGFLREVNGYIFYFYFRRSYAAWVLCTRNALAFCRFPGGGAVLQ
jgi:hypothetical protein